jgi:hypothetical protein
LGTATCCHSRACGRRGQVWWTYASRDSAQLSDSRAYLQEPLELRVTPRSGVTSSAPPSSKNRSDAACWDGLPDHSAFQLPSIPRTRPAGRARWRCSPRTATRDAGTAIRSRPRRFHARLSQTAERCHAAHGRRACSIVARIVGGSFLGGGLLTGNAHRLASLVRI